jgi:hypothetical protein
VELTQRRARVDPDLLRERPPRVLVRLQRLGLPARSVERQHELPAQALPVRVLGDEPLELADEPRVTAEIELRVDPVLEGGQA